MGYYQRFKFTTTDVSNTTVKIFFNNDANILLHRYISNNDISIVEDTIDDTSEDKIERYIKLVYSSEEVKDQFEADLNDMSPERDDISYEVLEEGSL